MYSCICLKEDYFWYYTHLLKTDSLRILYNALGSYSLSPSLSHSSLPQLISFVSSFFKISLLTKSVLPIWYSLGWVDIHGVVVSRAEAKLLCLLKKIDSLLLATISCLSDRGGISCSPHLPMLRAWQVWAWPSLYVLSGPLGAHLCTCPAVSRKVSLSSLTTSTHYTLSANQLFLLSPLKPTNSENDFFNSS